MAKLRRRVDRAEELFWNLHFVSMSFLGKTLELFVSLRPHLINKDNKIAHLLKYSEIFAVLALGITTIIIIPELVNYIIP